MSAADIPSVSLVEHSFEIGNTAVIEEKAHLLSQ